MPEGIEQAIVDKLENEGAPASEPNKPAQEPANPQEPAQEPVQEPEFDLGEGRKVKLSEVKEWEQGNLRQADYTKKTQELSQEREELKQLKEFGNYLKANPKKMEKVLKVIEEKEEAVKQTIEGIDDNDPTIQYMKQQNEIVLGELKSLKSQLQQRTQVDQVKTAQQMLNGTLDESVKSLDLSTEEKGIHRQLVLSHLKDNPKDYSNEGAFKSEIQDLSNNSSGKLKKLGGDELKVCLKSKETPEPPGTPAVPGSPLARTFSIDSLQQDIEKALEDSVK